MIPLDHPRPRTRRRRIAAGATGLALLAGAVSAAPAQAAPSQTIDPLNPNFGPNVQIFSPATPLAEIQSTMDALADQQRDAEMGSARNAVYFLPGDYGTAEAPLQFEVGYYTEVAGLGASPDDVSVNGSIEVYNRCLENGGTSNCIALNNFWRTLSNLSIQVNKAGQDGCRQSANFWAVSQAVSMRRVHVTGANLSLMDYCTAGPQFASGGFIADSDLPVTINGSQQQWIIRNSKVTEWTNGVWNQVFSGVEGAPAETGFPNPPYTTVAQTPVSREKPYLFVDGAGRYNVRVPSAHMNTSGTSWGQDVTAGRTLPITDFFIAKPGDSVKDINNALAKGKNLILTPGVYDIDRTIEVKRADTVVLGMGQATLTSAGGAVPMEVKNEEGIVIAGVTIDAGPALSPVLLKVGKEKSGKKLDPRNPITLSDVYFRVGGPHTGKTTTALEVNGDNVTATGMFVEHFQKFNTVWNGENGRVILYQNELPYDPPTQADWTQPDGTLGYPGYKVGPKVKKHLLEGAGVYVFNQNNPSIVTANGFTAPNTRGVTLRHIMTVNLAAGTIQHVVNGVGAQVDSSAPGVPSYVVQYPAP